ncbi:hypothetical protein U9M48_039267 [Paspalum notatum var. saurae]|uniref:DDE Tnp4 domain-containing protein n=1 Tax=Paspalum notatum var. saurae TaxID=547442 RepID=A0AAQ3UNM1_PASNO
MESAMLGFSATCSGLAARVLDGIDLDSDQKLRFAMGDGCGKREKDHPHLLLTGAKKNYIGAIDDKHKPPITIAEHRDPPYRNRKGILSHNVMVVSDFDLNFTFVSCGWEGSASDAGVLRSAISKGFSVLEGKFYLVDGEYANTSSFIAPYSEVRYHLNQFSMRRSSQSGYENYNELFNHCHAILRNHIERAIGVLKKRFSILKGGTFHPMENQIKIATATIAFPNIITVQNGDEGWLDNQPDYISPSQYVDVPKGDNKYLNDTESSDGSTVRNQIALQMWATYNS